MTIALSANTPRVSYTVSQGATQTAFTVNFEFFDAADLNFYVDGTLKTLTTHYTVSGGSGSTGTINTTTGNSVTGISGGSTVVITRSIAFARTTDFPSSGAFEVSKLNEELDRFTAIASDISDETSRSIQLADEDSAVSMELPLLASRKGTVLGFNASTGAVEAGPTIANVNSLSAITANINTVAGISGNVTTVAGISANTTTVAGISGNVSTVAGIASNVTTVAGKASLITSDFASDMALIDSTFVSKINLVTSDFVTDMSVVTSDFIADLNALANTAIIADLDLLATSDFISDLNAVEGIKANVTTVAGIASNVTSVAGNSSNINSAVSNASNINSAVSNASNINSAVSNASNINSVVSNASNINTVAGAITNVNNVGGSITNVNTVASNLSGVNSFAERYRVQSGVPSSNNDVGDLVFDTATNTLKVFSASGFQNAGSSVNGTSARFHYDISDTPTSVTGSDANGNTLAYDAGFVDVYVNGVRMSPADITVTSGSSVDFASALADGDEVDIVAFGTFSLASMNASNLDSGTIPDARFPATLPAISGANLTNLDATDLTGTIASARVSGAYTGITSVGTLTSFRSTGIDDNADALAMTIDSSENVMISKTSTAFGTAGVELSQNGVAGKVFITRSGGEALSLNRLSSNGEILGFYKDSSLIGQISGTIGLIVGTGDTGLGFQTSTGDAIIPQRPDTQAGSDNLLSFGNTSYRFKDMFLGGNLYIGGTGSSNALSDYEEGTFTPVFVNVNAPTYSSQVGKYTKIGNAIHCTVSIDVSTGLDTSDGSTVSIGGLPFTAVFSEQATNGFLGRYINLLGSKATSLSNIRQAETSIMLLQGHDSGIQYNQINSGGFLQIAFTYRTT
ncbi:tail fiber [uncultured Mediterranean phage uvMED]|nr:tail fiber [uncultured Mediterranean phage uvMED]